MKKVFCMTDVDRSGEIDSRELESAYEDLGYQCARFEIEDLFHEVDCDGTGRLDMREYLHVVRLHREKDLARIRYEFDNGSTHEEHGWFMKAVQVPKAVRALGYDSTGIEIPQAPSFDFDGFVEIVDSQRGKQVHLRLGKTRFPTETVERFKEMFTEHLSGSNVLNPISFSDFLSLFGREPKTRKEQEELMKAYHHAQKFGPKARNRTMHK